MNENTLIETKRETAHGQEEERFLPTSQDQSRCEDFQTRSSLSQENSDSHLLPRWPKNKYEKIDRLYNANSAYF